MSFARVVAGDVMPQRNRASCRGERSAGLFVATTSSIRRMSFVLIVTRRAWLDGSGWWSPVQTVQILNDVFSIFDELADQYGVEKIKTIGDAYMAAAGLEAGAQIHFADAVAMMALDMQKRCDQYRERTGERVELRIGIGTGPVVAGVIGKKKFIYDMWGDTVNVAARLCSLGDGCSVHLSEEASARVHDGSAINHIGKVSLKGKGEIEVYCFKFR